eukprot:gi/632947559/ref/XP_007889107.1/ PREDICTED: membrane-associated guanylate kinase, WW and PDZ domain-containing protein 2-like isoform X1 [Callorhinchus milii]
MSKVLKKKSHWTNKVHETVLCRNKDGELNVEIRGGAENGQFSFLGEIKQNRVMYQGGRLHADELLLEVNDTPVSGLTIRDVLAVIRHCKDPIRLKCVKQEFLTLAGVIHGTEKQSVPTASEGRNIEAYTTYELRSIYLEA